MSGVLVLVMSLQSLNRLQSKDKGECRHCGLVFKIYMKYVTTKSAGPKTSPLCIPCAEKLNVI